MEHFIPRQETKVLDAGSSKPVTPLAQERVAHGRESLLLSGDIRSEFEASVLCCVQGSCSVWMPGS